MKIAEKIAYYVLALPFLVFGLNYFFNFLPMPPMEGPAGTFMGILATTGFLAVVKVLEIVYAVMLFANIKRKLVLVLLAPIAVNILMFEIFITGMPGIGVLLVALIVFLLLQNKKAYAGMLND